LKNACPRFGNSLHSVSVFTAGVGLFVKRNALLGGDYAGPQETNGKAIQFAISFQNDELCN
jgi:hypothetical protein